VRKQIIQIHIDGIPESREEVLHSFKSCVKSLPEDKLKVTKAIQLMVSPSYYWEFDLIANEITFEGPESDGNLD